MQELRISQVPQARQVIGHSVEYSRYVIWFGEVSEVTMVETVETEEVCGWAISSGGPFVCPGNGIGIVAKWGNSPVFTVVLLDQGVILCNLACQFELGVVDETVRVGKGHEVLHNVGRKLLLPHER